MAKIYVFGEKDRPDLLRECKKRYKDPLLAKKSFFSALVSDYLMMEFKHLMEAFPQDQRESIAKGYDIILRGMYGLMVAPPLDKEEFAIEFETPEESSKHLLEIGLSYGISVLIDAKTSLAHKEDIVMAAINKYFINKGERVDQPPNSGGHP